MNTRTETFWVTRTAAGWAVTPGLTGAGSGVFAHREEAIAAVLARAKERRPDAVRVRHGQRGWEVECRYAGADGSRGVGGRRLV